MAVLYINDEYRQQVDDDHELWCYIRRENSDILLVTHPCLRLRFMLILHHENVTISIFLFSTLDAYIRRGITTNLGIYTSIQVPIVQESESHEEAGILHSCNPS